jgi:hypothetical protein
LTRFLEFLEPLIKGPYIQPLPSSSKKRQTHSWSRLVLFSSWFWKEPSVPVLLFLVWGLCLWEQIFGFIKISGFEDFSKYFQHDLSSLRLDLVPNNGSNYNLKLFIKLVLFNKCTMSKIKYCVLILLCIVN